MEEFFANFRVRIWAGIFVRKNQTRESEKSLANIETNYAVVPLCHIFHYLALFRLTRQQLSIKTK